jgi:hypothetical protein
MKYTLVNQAVLADGLPARVEILPGDLNEAKVAARRLRGCSESDGTFGDGY